MVPECSQLSKLGLANNKVGDKGAEQLADSRDKQLLKGPPTLCSDARSHGPPLRGNQSFLSAEGGTDSIRLLSTRFVANLAFSSGK